MEKSYLEVIPKEVLDITLSFLTSRDLLIFTELYDLEDEESVVKYNICNIFNIAYPYLFKLMKDRLSLTKNTSQTLFYYNDYLKLDQCYPILTRYFVAGNVSMDILKTLYNNCKTVPSYTYGISSVLTDIFFKLILRHKISEVTQDLEDLKMNEVIMFIIIFCNKDNKDNKLEEIGKYYKNITGDNNIDMIIFGLNMISLGSRTLELIKKIS
jgi:hypothetical protein